VVPPDRHGATGTRRRVASGPLETRRRLTVDGPVRHGAQAGTLAKVPRIPTAPIAAGSLIGGYLVARTTRVRPLGAVPLVIGGSWCTKQWRDRAGAPAAGGLLAIFLGAFGGSHPLAKRIGPWLSVISVAALSGLASWLMADRRR